ncbi:MAG: Lrp/AsnC family transcriptional regulator [Clostridia bacterium]|nr:Lrp/AsnC family transcriptional regulator [Clostridia bacterium]
MIEILEILENNAKASVEEIAKLTGKSVKEVKEIISDYENDKTIVGYSSVINWEKTDNDFVTALIEVRVTPQRDRGFDKIAERIYKYDQVKSCSLMSGSYDLSVMVEGKNIKEVALFVSEKLSTIDGVLSTATHFVLKKYKDKSMMFNVEEKDDREAIVL